LGLEILELDLNDVIHGGRISGWQRRWEVRWVEGEDVVWDQIALGLWRELGLQVMKRSKVASSLSAGWGLLLSCLIHQVVTHRPTSALMVQLVLYYIR